MSRNYTDAINWRFLFRFSISCVLILILLLAGPVNCRNLKNVQMDGGVLEDVYRVSERRGSSPKLVLIVDGQRYKIRRDCMEDSLKNVQAILQRRVGEHVYLRYYEDFFRRREIVELDYMGLKLVDYDFAMAYLKPLLKENAYVGVTIGLLYTLVLVVLKLKPDILKKY